MYVSVTLSSSGYAYVCYMSLSCSVLFYSVQVQNIELDIMADLITSHLFHTFSVKPFFFCMKNPFFVFIIQTMVDPFFFSQF